MVHFRDTEPGGVHRVTVGPCSCGHTTAVDLRDGVTTTIHCASCDRPLVKVTTA